MGRPAVGDPAVERARLVLTGPGAGRVPGALQAGRAAAEDLRVSTPEAAGPPVRLRRLVLGVAAVGILAQLLVGLLVRADGAVQPLGAAGAPGWAVALGLLAATFASDWVCVRVRHGQEQVEELTLFEVAVVIDVLVLPAVPALLLPVAATLLCSLVRRREAVKVVFNVGNLAAAVAVLVGTVHLVSAPAAGLSVRTVAGLTAGMLAFTAVNLVALSRVLGVVGGADPWQVVREGLRLSTVLALGSMALGSTALTLAWASPALLPFAFMPAGALLFAYRAAAQEAEERARSTSLLQLSQLLAGRREADDLLPAFLELVRQTFSADVAVAVLDSDGNGDGHGDGAAAVCVERDGGATRRAATAAERALLGHPASVLSGSLPDGWSRALVAPLEAEGRRLGAVVLGTRDRTQPLGPRELTLLTPTAAALAVALRAAAHLCSAREETGKLQAVVDQSSDGILVLDAAGVVQLWSPAVAALSGRSAAAALGRRLPELLATRGPDGAACDPFLVGSAPLTPDAPQVTVELTLLRGDGEQRVVRAAFAGAFSPDRAELQRVVVIAHDVTRERQVERLKADFIATVSHELRTPVTPIRGYADLLRRRGDRMTPAKRQECLDTIVDRANHLARLVEDLLLASRISATEGAPVTQVDMGVDDLAALTRRACEDFGPDGERITAVLPDVPVRVACDGVRVIQVLTNLVGNALKYSAAGSAVQVRLAVEDGVARLEVSDEGRGIPADQVEKVFEKFHRVEDPLRMTTGGTGLGLYIAQQLTAAMGGTLACTSTLGVGSVFRFTLPLATAADRAPAGARPERRTPPWAVPPPRPAPGPGQAAPLPLG